MYHKRLRRHLHTLYKPELYICVGKDGPHACTHVQMCMERRVPTHNLNPTLDAANSVHRGPRYVNMLTTLPVSLDELHANRKRLSQRLRATVTPSELRSMQTSTLQVSQPVSQSASANVCLCCFPQRMVRLSLELTRQ